MENICAKYMEISILARCKGEGTIPHLFQMGGAYFKHELKKFKLGIIVYDKQAIEDKLKEMLKKYAVTRTDKYNMKEKKVKLKDGKTSKRN